MTTQDLAFYLFYGSLELFLIYLFCATEGRDLIRKYRKKRKRRAKAF